MTYFHACVGCAVDKRTCCDLDRLKSILGGFGVTSLKHKCKSRQPKFTPGCGVFIRTVASMDTESEYYDDDGPTIGIFPGVFIEEKASKGFAFIKPGTPDKDGTCEFDGKNDGYVKVPLSRITMRESAPVISVEQCNWCCKIPSLTGKCGNPDPFGRNECLHRKMQQAEAAE